jgi:hypothetical protein
MTTDSGWDVQDLSVPVVRRRPCLLEAVEASRRRKKRKK